MRYILFILLLIPSFLFAQSTFKKGVILGENGNVIDSAKVSGIHFNFYNSGTVYPTGVSWGNTIIVAPTGGDYSTVDSAVQAATAWDVIIVHPGTYDENITINKNIGIQLKTGTILDYTDSDDTATVTIYSGITAYISGGIIRRTNTNYGRAIDNAGILYVTSDIENTATSVTYIIDNFVDAELYITNNHIINTGYETTNRAYFDGKVYIDTKKMSFNWMIDSVADVYIEADKMVVDSTRQQISYVKMGSKLTMNIDQARLYLYDGVEVEGYAGQTISDSSEFVYTGNYNFPTGGGTRTKITLYNAYCNEGIPRIGVHNDADSGYNYVTIANCNFKWIYPDRMPDGLTPPTGQHYFENASDTAYCIFRIENSFIQWSEPVAIGDTSRELGNIFYFNGGEMYLSNTTFVDYNDDYSGYGNIATLVSSKVTRIYNCQFLFYGHQNGPMFTMLDRTDGSAYWDLEFQNCHFARRQSDYTGAFFHFSWQNRTLDENDHLIFQNCTFGDDSASSIQIFAFGDGGGGSITFDDFLNRTENNFKTQQYMPNQRIGDVRMIGPGHFSSTKEYFGYRVKMNDWATYEGLSVADTVDLIVTWKEEIGAADNGEIPRRNWLDLDLKLMIRDSNLVASPYYYRYYDIRVFAVQPGDGLEVTVDTSVFANQTGISNPAISWTTSQAGSDQYIKFQIINNDATYAITLDAWLRQSLNNESVIFTEPHIE